MLATEAYLRMCHKEDIGFGRAKRQHEIIRIEWRVRGGTENDRYQMRAAVAGNIHPGWTGISRKPEVRKVSW